MATLATKTKQTGETVKVNYKIPAADLDELRRAAQRFGLSMSEIVRVGYRRELVRLYKGER